MRLGVVHLARAANDPRWLAFFLASLARHDPGVPYDLVVIRKGYPDPAPDPALAAFRAPSLGRVIQIAAPDETFATNLFLDVAREVDHAALLFFVSWARILAPGWGRILLEGLARPGTGVVGGSAGWEALDASTPFPNRSVRTTGFAIRRETWLSLDPGDLSTKRGGNRFEAGPASMTRQILDRGLAALVAGRDGRFFGPEDWPASRTFRSGDQENLLFADNRTQDYWAGSLRRRQKLARLNWGDEGLAAPAGLVARLRRRLWWRFGRGL